MSGDMAVVEHLIDSMSDAVDKLESAKSANDSGTIRELTKLILGIQGQIARELA